MPCQNIDGVGPPVAALCAGTACTEGVSCATTQAVGGSAVLSAALNTATAGSCIVVEPGSYGAVALPDGVHLLGKGAAYVTVASVAASGGSIIRGVNVQGDGVVVSGGTDVVRLDSSCVIGSSANGVDVSSGAAVEIVATHIVGASGYGVRASEAASVALEKTLLTDLGGPGLWVSGDACEAATEVAMSDVAIDGASLVGMSLDGTDASLAQVRVRNTKLLNFQGGGGIALSCSDVTAAGIDVEVSGGGDLEAYGAFGLLANNVSGDLGAPGDNAGIIIVGGRPGIWVGGGLGAVGPKLENFHVSNSNGVGVGVGAETVGIIIVGGKVWDTSADTIPLAGGGAGNVGDGLLWGNGAQLQIDGLDLAGSGRQSMLIDGAVAANSSIANITLSDGDDQTGIVQQGVEGSDVSPTEGAGAPSVSKEPSDVFDVPAEPKSPQAS